MHPQFQLLKRWRSETQLVWATHRDLISNDDDGGDDDEGDVVMVISGNNALT